MLVRLAEITDQNREAVLALSVARGQQRFVSSVGESLAQAAAYPHGFYRRLGFVPTGDFDEDGEVIARLTLAAIRP